MEQLEKKYNGGIKTENICQSCKDRDMNNDIHSISRTYCSNKIKSDSTRSSMVRNESVIPDADESKKFWTDIWSVGEERNRSAEWLNNIRNDIGDNQQGELEITSDMVTSQCGKLPNWKAPGRDGVQGFWLKKVRGLHGRNC